MKDLLSLSLIFIFSISMTAQNTDNPPYAEIPTAPEVYNGPNVLARSIDGLGYRLYWATEGLTNEALNYDPGNDNRSINHLIDHLLSLSFTILNTVEGKPNIRPEAEVEGNFLAKRAMALSNLKRASDALRNMTDSELAETQLIFQRGEKSSEFPLWNLINGPVADAMYHTGQVVSYRRSAGNPINSKVNVFMGKNRS